MVVKNGDNNGIHFDGHMTYEWDSFSWDFLLREHNPMKF